jgi:asparagine synthase (glutamine-hydrolysing)
MCGLTGWFGRPGNEDDDQALARAMVAAIVHRGPDGNGIHVDEGDGRRPAVGLGHARLAIVGLGDGAQPLSNAEGTLTVVFNGEIFNYVELRAELMARGRRFLTTTDTEVLLALYELEGDDFLDKLNGDFAFALHDARRGRLLLARDRMGVRPLYYTEHAGRLWFASEVKVLAAVPGLRLELDPIALDQIFTLWAPIAPRTAFAGIRQLQPGELAIADADGWRQRLWWTLDFPDRDDARPERPRAEDAAELRALLEDATRLRMRADVPVGTYLSGGLDSSITSALAARMTPLGLNSFSVTFDDAEHDESAFQNEMAQALGTNHAAIRCREADIAAAFPAVIASTECPILRTAPAPLHRLSSLVRARGMKVVLTGEGADEVFAGYDLFSEAAVRRFVGRAPGSKARPLLFRRLYPWQNQLNRQSPAQLAAVFGGGDAADPLFSHRPRFKSTAQAKLFFGPALKDRLAGYDATEELLAALPARFHRWHPLNQAQYLETRFLLAGYILSSQGDRVAMAHGVEGRFPFLDHRVVAFASRLPPAAKLCGLKEKHILRRAMGDLLPADIANRRKQPYRAPDARSFTAALAADGPIGAALSEPALAATGLFEPGLVRRLVDKTAAHPDASFRDNAAFVGILSTQLWVDRFRSSTVA